MRLAGAGEPAPVRSYSLSASAADSYRISVKRESHGVASGYIATTLAVGDDVDVAAPRGEFVLGDGDEPVVLLSAGIGVTPVLAMLQALAAQGSTRPVWWLHTTQRPATHALAAEADRLVDSLPNGAQPRLLHRDPWRSGRVRRRRRHPRPPRSGRARRARPADRREPSTCAVRPASWTR